MNRRCLVSSRRVFVTCMVLITAFLLYSRDARAQGQFGTITGLVVDPGGKSVPGADVTITNQQTAVESRTVSNSDGNYTVTSLQPGTYSLAAAKAGFNTVTQTGIRLDVAQTARIDVALQVGS